MGNGAHQNLAAKDRREYRPTAGFAKPKII
jgi:hypothetical protein